MSSILDNLKAFVSKDRNQRRRMSVLCEHFMEEVGNCHSFADLLRCHQRIFASGIKLSRLEHEQTGMFRSPATVMTLDSVYLGNICGLFTKTASYWDRSPDPFARKICLRQWQNTLIANLRIYQQEIMNWP